jgi:hypothetical protein
VDRPCAPVSSCLPSYPLLIKCSIIRMHRRSPLRTAYKPLTPLDGASAARRLPTHDSKIPLGTVMETTQFGMSTISLILRSPATLQMAYASCRLRP